MSTNIPIPPGDDPPATTFKLRRKARRRVSHNGNSNTISIPREFMSRLGILPAGEVDLTLYEDVGGFFVKPVTVANLTGRAGNP